MIKNPTKPILTAFLSYSKADLPLIIPFVNGLRKSHVEVNLYQENEQIGVRINEWIINTIAECDCIIVIISENTLKEDSWVTKEVGTAITLFAKKGELNPEIVPVKLSNYDFKITEFQPRSLLNNEPVGPPIIWSDFNCLMLDTENVEETIDRFVQSFEPKTTFITNPENPKQKLLFDNALRLYKNLLPDRRERDRGVDIADWLLESWDEDDQPEENGEWLHTLAVHHIEEKVIGIFWCSIHRQSGIGFVAFWGLMASHRAYGRGIIFAREVIGALKRVVPNIRALLFAAERVEWEVLDEFLEDSFKVWEEQFFGKVVRRDRYSNLSEPLGSKPSAISQMLESISEERRDELIAQLRKFRRFSLYANGANFNKVMAQVDSKLMAFINRDVNFDEFTHISQLMANFVQPPIRPPVNESGDCYLWLFALIFNNHNLSAAEAIDWIYDVFLKDSLGSGRTELTGWNNYMIEFKEKWRDSFAKQAEIKFLRLRDSFSEYNMILTEVKRHWLREKAQGRAEGGWDIEL